MICHLQRATIEQTARVALPMTMHTKTANIRKRKHPGRTDQQKNARREIWVRDAMMYSGQPGSTNPKNRSEEVIKVSKVYVHI